jgi:diguanylate cyclase (GGDEF)-like protein
MMLMFIVVKKVSKLLFIPAVINMLIAFSAFFTDISYGFDEKLNSFYRNPLGYTPYVVTILYIVLLFFFTIKKISKTSLQEDIALVFIPVTAMIAAVMSFYDHDEVVNLTYGAEILLYYLYVYTQYTKRDALTGLLNRQAFYRDTEKGNYSISGVISIDMNYLKQINDTHGHHAGDKALKSVAKCFVDAIGSTDRVYRIGGDEFVVLCKDRSQEDIEKLAEEMRSAVTQSGYSCAFGICSGDTVKKMIKQADRLMYGDKVRIKAQTDTVGEGG